MALTQDQTGYYYNSDTGSYYSPYNKPAPVVQSTNWFGGPKNTYSLFAPNQSLSNRWWGEPLNNTPKDPAGMISQNGNYYIPFTGNAPGITQGMKSMADILTMNKPQASPYPTVQSLFGNSSPLQFSSQPSTGYGASRFTGGLLGPSLTFTGTNT